ncbi:hypothetical protein Tco_1028142 [Tanacetum coccineum]
MGLAQAWPKDFLRRFGEGWLDRGQGLEFLESQSRVCTLQAETKGGKLQAGVQGFINISAPIRMDSCIEVGEKYAIDYGLSSRSVNETKEFVEWFIKARRWKALI